MKSRALVSLLLAGVLSQAAHAGFEVGNGGQGVRIDGKIRLLDLVESGLQNSPFFDPSISPDPAFVSRLTDTLSNLPSAPVRLIATKLQELRAISPSVAYALLLASERLQWRPVDTELEAIPDRGGVIETGAYEIIQLAVRAGRTVRIHRPSWLVLEPSHQAALVIHELVYALIPPSNLGGGYQAQNAVRAREITAYLFSTALPERGADGLLGILGTDLGTGPGYARLDSQGFFDEAHVQIGLFVPVKKGEYAFYQSWNPKLPPQTLARSLCKGAEDLLRDPIEKKIARIQVSFSTSWRELTFIQWTSPRGPQSALSLSSCISQTCATIEPVAERKFSTVRELPECVPWVLSTLRSARDRFEGYEAPEFP